MLARLEVTVSGAVQGVGYRYTAFAFARALGLRGWVRNQPDGSVRLVAEGERESLQALLDWCYTGPRSARVQYVEVTWDVPRGDLPEFSIL